MVDCGMVDGRAWAQVTSGTTLTSKVSQTFEICCGRCEPAATSGMGEETLREVLWQIGPRFRPVIDPPGGLTGEGRRT
jgi:hypothetical protein